MKVKNVYFILLFLFSIVNQAYVYTAQSPFNYLAYLNYLNYFPNYFFYDPYDPNNALQKAVGTPNNFPVNEQSHTLFQLIRENEIKQDYLDGPFGKKKVVYCDYTASGRPLEFIEQYIKDKVLPTYANTHTLQTETANQTTMFRDEARQIIKKSVNANDHDVVIFTGSGSTSAINKLARVLKFEQPPIVFLSLYEHHSNLLIWREIAKHVITIGEDKNGNIDLNELENQLKHYRSDPQYSKSALIGSFSAASNITGILTNVNEIAKLMHRYHGLVFFDYAAAAPYVEIDMNPSNDDDRLTYKDAIFISTHKFVGGPQTPGILVAKNYLFQNEVPDGLGGGTVYYVTAKSHEYLKNIEEREEGGTPAIVESIRAGLVFKLKEDCNPNLIFEKEEYYTQKIISFFKDIKNLKLLGSVSIPRLPIFSFVIENAESGYYLHHNYVSALLNDLFGIQTRSGCACAGPYAQHLMGVSAELAETYLTTVKKAPSESGHNILRPGFTRFSVTYFMDEETVDYVLKCIKFVTENGWMFLPFYGFDIDTGLWKYKSILFQKAAHQKLSDIEYFKENKMNVNLANFKIPDSNNYNTYLAIAEDYVQQFQTLNSLSLIQNEIERPNFSEDEYRLIWFLLPNDAYKLLYNKIISNTNTNATLSQSTNYLNNRPFSPYGFPYDTFLNRTPSYPNLVYNFGQVQQPMGNNQFLSPYGFSQNNTPLSRSKSNSNITKTVKHGPFSVKEY